MGVGPQALAGGGAPASNKRKMAESPLNAPLLAPARLAHRCGAVLPKDLYTRAVQLEADGNQPAALALLWEAAGLAPRDADVQQRLGEALERIGALDAAIDAYRRAIAARPDFIRADNSLTLALAKAGRGPEAVERARARVAEAPGDPERLFTLGLAQSEQDVDAAIRTFERVIAMRPDHVLAYYNLALVLKRVDRAKDAIAALQRALAIQPRAEAHFALGTLYFHQGEFDRASAALKAAVAAEPRLVDAHIALGSVFKAKRQLPEAIDAFRRAIALSPTPGVRTRRWRRCYSRPAKRTPPHRKPPRPSAVGGRASANGKRRR